MSNNTVIITRPIKSGCNFNAVGNPIVYTLRREDYSLNQINNSGGFAQVQINGSNLTAYFQVGNTIYIGLSGYNNTAEITASSFSGGNTLITTDRAYLNTGTGYVNNLSKRTDYRIELEVFDFDTDESMGPRISSNPDNSGQVKINISGIVSSYVSPNWIQPTISATESQTGKKAYIKYQEYYDAAYADLVDDDDNPIVCVFAIINLLLNSPPNFYRYAHGGNFLSFMPEDDTRLWITRMSSPSMWRGWPFTISFLWPDISSITRRVKQYNSSGTELSNTATALNGSIDTVHRMDLGTINALAKEVIVTLEDTSGSGDGVVITNELSIQIKDVCPSQVLLFWKNSLGGDSWWMFDESQDYQYTYPSGRKVTRMRLFSDNLQLGEWDAINELCSPSDVMSANITDYGMDNSIDKTQFRNDNQVFIVNQNGEKVGVVVNEIDNSTKTMYKKHAIEISIDLPEIFTV